MSFPLVRLSGSARTRGRAQALQCPETIPLVQEAIRTRLAAAAGQLAQDAIRTVLSDQRAATERLAPQVIEEIAGLSEGFGVSEEEIFAFLHLSMIADIAAPAVETDGCTAFAMGNILGKNRDFRPEHAALQRVFLHRDPAWGSRSVLCVGSLGAPGPWSSGMNSDGLAMADTHVSTSDHGIGLHRYFLMNRILAECATVAEAVALVTASRHAGGGNLVLSDASATAAAVELRHNRVDISLANPIARTNHFTAAADPLAPVSHSQARLDTISAAIGRGAAPRALLTLHEPEAVCRHRPEPSPTLSASLYDTVKLTADIALGQPCISAWQHFSLAAEAADPWSGE
jgi:hypothetical protein